MCKRSCRWGASLAALLFLAVPVAAQQSVAGERVRIESADQLPRHTYRVRQSATELVEDDAQFGIFAETLEADLRSDLAKYEITDRSTLKEYYGTLGSLALIEGDYASAIIYAEMVRSIEDKPALKILAGTLERALAEAAAAPLTYQEQAFEDAYRKVISGLPYEQVQAELKTLKGMTEIMSPGITLGFIQGQVEPAAKSGQISRELANLVVQARLTIEVLEPFREEMVAVLGETIADHTIQKPDIWAARDASLEGRVDLTPVVIGIWDSGVDVLLFQDRLFVNAAEIPANGLDDDRNGFPDDVHGIAYDLRGRKTTGSLISLSYGEEDEAKFRRYLKGVVDLQAGLDTPAASEFRRLAAEIEPEEFRPFFEGFLQYANYAHGTHVAGIAARDNPAARVLVGRITFDYRLVPELPTMELSEGLARSYREAVAYFRDHGVRVVNMSWGTTPEYYETALEANNAGGTGEERRAMARRLFDVESSGLREAMASAPEILFVTAAGNADGDNRFVDDMPASFDLPNLITAAAVDRAGDEAAFTSYGKVETYANGYEVESYLPGGEIHALSGTSMASPQVVNLAAKLLAVYPDLTVSQLRKAIIEGAEEKTIGEEKTIRLLNPKQSFEILAERLTSAE